jgi:hypothetical protein
VAIATQTPIPADSPVGSLAERFVRAGAEVLYAKILSPNDNSKNQIYLAGSLEVLTSIPFIRVTDSGRDKKGDIRYKAALNFSWVLDNGQTELAEGAQLIVYPKYPEVRLSGFLKGCENAPNDVLTVREPGRVLFLGVTRDRRILASAHSAASSVATQVQLLNLDFSRGVLAEVPVTRPLDTERELLTALCDIHRLDWIASKRLKSSGEMIACNAPQCVGYTLEAELGIKPNSLAEPDYLGWELKAYTVPNFAAPGSKVVTLMTPEPDAGLYQVKGPLAFMHAYGYPDKKGREGRTNFSSPHRFNVHNSRTQLTLLLEGFDATSMNMTHPDGGIVLIDGANKVAAKWSFPKLLEHWNRKHDKAAFVPAEKHAATPLRYRYAPTVGLGTGTDFLRVLKAIAAGLLYYDPGLKLVIDSAGRETVKRRNQFRMNSSALPSLYGNYRWAHVQP